MNLLGWTRTRWAIPALLFLAVILAAGLAFNLANLETGGAPLPVVQDAPTSPQFPLSFLDLLPFIHGFMVVVLGLVIVVFVLSLLYKQKRRIVPGRGNRWYLIQIAVMLAVFFLLFALAPANPSSEGQGGEPTPTGEEDPSLPPAEQRTVAGVPVAFLFAGALLVGLVILSFFLVPAALRRARLAAAQPTSQRREAAVAVGDAIRTIELGADVRSTILRCFLRFCELLGAKGISRQDVLTPRELEGLAIQRLALPAEAARDLTGLFEEARYSLHQLGPTERSRAVDNLERLRAVLEG